MSETRQTDSGVTQRSHYDLTILYHTTYCNICLSGNFDSLCRETLTIYVGNWGFVYSSGVNPCWMANLTRPGRSLMPNLRIRRLR